MPHRPLPARWIDVATAARPWRITSVLLLLLVTVLALMPTVPRDLSLGWDKLNHAAAFFALAITWRLGFPGPAWRWVQLAAGLMLLGGAIEVAQHFVPGRQADAADLLADGIGVAAGLVVVAALERLLRRRLPPPVRHRAG